MAAFILDVLVLFDQSTIKIKKMIKFVTYNVISSEVLHGMIMGVTRMPLPFSFVSIRSKRSSALVENACSEYHQTSGIGFRVVESTTGIRSVSKAIL